MSIKRNKTREDKTFKQEKGADWILWNINSPGAFHMDSFDDVKSTLQDPFWKKLFETHSHSLKNESLVTLMTEV